MSLKNKEKLNNISHKIEITISSVKFQGIVAPEFAKKVDDYMEKRRVLLERFSK